MQRKWRALDFMRGLKMRLTPFAKISCCLLLASCAATGTQMQAECEAKHRDFPAIFQCTYDAVVQRNPRILEDSRAKLYLLRGEQLAVAVLQQGMSSLDARVEWQRLYVELRAAKEQEVAASLTATSQALQAARIAAPLPSPQITPAAPRRAVNCSSMMLGTTVYTTCN